jgi:hypothetical protein
LTAETPILPPHIQAAQAQLSEALKRVPGGDLDLVTAPWGEIESAVAKLLGGPFSFQRPEHQMIALGLSGVFGARLMKEAKAFWFPNRDALEGANLGFEEALVMLSPFSAVVDALGSSQLERLEQIAVDIRRSIAQVRFQAAPGQPPVRLGARDYQRLFDPGFLQFAVLDPTRAKQAWESKPSELVREVRDALGRTKPPMPEEAKQQFEAQILGSLSRLEAGKPLSDQIELAPRVAELMAHLFATVGGTGSAPEEFWQGYILPLLFIGVPENFPPLDDEELEAFRQGADVLSLFAEVVPYSRRAPEEGLLGAIDVSALKLPHPAFQRVQAPRLLQIDADAVLDLVKDFDADKTRDALNRFSAYLEEKSGAKAQESEPARQMQEAALLLLTDLRRALMEKKGQLMLRRLTEAEAASEPAVAVVRQALQGPRIIL